IAILALVGVAISLVINAAILRLALQPLADLERTAERVHRGEFTARAGISPLADRDLERVIRTQNEMLDALTHYRNRLRDITARAQNAAEEERKRIARELHDDTAQALAAILIRLRLLERATSEDARDQLLRDVRGQVSETLEGVRRFARGLRPPALDDLGLVAAVANHARGLEQAGGLEVTVDADQYDGANLSPEAELTVYRNIQEALSNVLRHANATKAWITLRREGDHVVAVVEDNGRGFSPEAVERSGAGLGIFGMRERAEYIDGEVRIESRPGKGTRVTIRVPIER
ncbi:MAG TPA: sensor histidine kinase, partial [Longimicrobiales bacterium]|nr:sensor histidine kinase [Longimicrobiales bacterium]